MKRLSALLLGAVLVTSLSPMVAKADKGYTYTYDWWEDVQYSPDMYEVVGVVTAPDMGVEGKLSQPQGMFVKGNMIYICDTGNNRIIEIERTGLASFKQTRIIDSFYGNVDVKTFNNPTDIAVSDEGELYIADMNNGRILKLDNDLNYIMEFKQPVDPTIDPTTSFLPSKLAVDLAGRVYCVARNINQGVIKYEPDGTFSRFVGAQKVTYNMADYIQKKLATKAQREQMASFVPTEYSNIYMDHEGFQYVCSVNCTEDDLRSGSTDPIRRLNLMGNDILVRNGNFDIIGDMWWNGGESGYDGPSRITDITALENEIYVGLDKLRGRLFGYNEQGMMVFAFGGNGNMDGYFVAPAAIDHMGNDLFVLDSIDCSLTVFSPTEFGKLVYDAIELFQDGKYTESGEAWEKSLTYNGNFDLAYIGIGRSLLRQEKYKEAMEYFELKWDDENYSKAFRQYRKEWVEDNIAIIVLILLVLIIVPSIRGWFKKAKFMVDTADIFKE